MKNIFDISLRFPLETFLEILFRKLFKKTSLRIISPATCVGINLQIPLSIYFKTPLVILLENPFEIPLTTSSDFFSDMFGNTWAYSEIHDPVGMPPAVFFK